MSLERCTMQSVALEENVLYGFRNSTYDAIFISFPASYAAWSLLLIICQRKNLIFKGSLHLHTVFAILFENTSSSQESI
jgi:hypothetical protein